MPNPATIRIAMIDFGFYRAVAEVLKSLLAVRGYRSVLEPLPRSATYPRLAGGEFHLFCTAWLPRRDAVPWREHGRNLECWSTVQDGARFFLALAEDQLADVTSIAQLRNPNLPLERRIQVLPPRSNLTRLTVQAIKRYDLGAAGFFAQPGSTKSWRSSFDRARAGDSTLLALWSPLSTDGLQLRRLADPLGVFGKPDTAYLVAHRSAHDAIDPDTVAALRQLSLARYLPFMGGLSGTGRP